MNGFASTQPRFDKPAGAAGPNATEENTLQGWVRAYGSVGNRDSDNNFAAYDSDTWGSVIGIDKSFGNLLIGIAGGYAQSEIDAGSAYFADIKTYHGSIYSTIGGESLYIDLAATYGHSDTKEKSDLSPSSQFDSDIYSAYIGIGKGFDIKEKISLTPEVTFLASFYEQQAYDRTGLLGTSNIDSYDTQSYMGTVGINLATIHQLDWLSQDFACIPEIRAHWLHDFNADPDEYTYSLSGTPYTFGVRPREENLFRLGCGFDMWSWKHQNAKFEVDYDGLFSAGYTEHVISGKMTYLF